MSERFKLIKLGEGSRKSTSSSTTDWSLCFLCQEDHKGKSLVNPSRNKDVSTKNAAYMAMANRLIEFAKYGPIPMGIKIERLDDGTGVSNTLQVNHALYHKNCYLQISDVKLERAKKRQCEEPLEDQSPRKTRQSLDTSVGSGTDANPVCFFCEKTGGLMHAARTKDINETVKSYALILGDKKLLAKLAMSDMHALNAKYHKDCLTELSNKARESSRSKDKSGAAPISADSIALAELVTYINEQIEDVEAPVFQLSTLTRRYQDRIQQLGSVLKANSTRLKKRLLDLVPGLKEASHGRDVLLSFDRVIGDALKLACKYNEDEDAMVLVKAAKLVRKEMFQKQTMFSGTFDKDCQQKSVPQNLVTLVKMILEGPNIEHQSDMESTRNVPAYSICQLLMYNSVQHRKSKGGHVKIRHDVSKETPLTVYNGLKLHVKSRKKQLIDRQHQLGLSIGYLRVLQISNDFANSLCEIYKRDGVVCPPNLHKNVFQTGALDNLDNDPKSTTAKWSFHGTAISLTSHLSSDQLGERSEIVLIKDGGHRTRVDTLPDEYTIVPPAALQNKSPLVPVSYADHITPGCAGETYVHALEEESQWLNAVAQIHAEGQLRDGQPISWSAYHADRHHQVRPVAKVATLPLFSENAHSVAMVKHGMEVVKKAIQHLNPQQIPVITMDQPLYSLSKQIQWQWQDTLGEDNYVVVLGGLHIEMVMLSVIGDWLDGSGWSAAIAQAGITTPGRAESLTSASHVTRARYAHQVTVATLHILRDLAYEQYVEESADEAQSYDTWCSEKAKEFPQFLYWSRVIDLELLLNQYVKSLRTGNFLLYVNTLEQMIPWIFALDHGHYARWLPVHIRDMRTLEQRHPTVYAEFLQGKFVVQRSSHKFSLIALDHSHEQLNKDMKGEGGTVGIMDNPSALRRWMLAGPELARVVGEFEESMEEADHSDEHHEQSPKRQKDFLQDVRSLTTIIDEMGNPFLEDSQVLLTLDTKDIMGNEVVDTVKRAEAIGHDQYKEFVADRLQTNAKSIMDKITRNDLPLFKNQQPKSVSKTQTQMNNLKKDCQLFSRLYIGCQSRGGDLKEFFAHENQQEPPSLSSSGKLRQGTKSDLVPCLEKHSDELEMGTPNTTVIIIDGAAIVNMKRPRGAKTFDEYADVDILPYMRVQLENTQRLDIVWDQYPPNSIKDHAREQRGSGTRRRVEGRNILPKNWNAFLRNSANKTELFSFLASRLTGLDPGAKQIFITSGDTILTAHDDDHRALTAIEPCNHEEADTRMLLHAAHASVQGHRKILIRTVDTDVVVLAIGFFRDLQLDELWVAYGTGNNYRVIPAHEIAFSLGIRKSAALPTFHAITGCDVTSAFAGRGKKTCWDVWTVFPEVTSAFLSLSTCPELIPQETSALLERFVIYIYSKTLEAETVNEARQILFSKGNRTLENIPPTQGALQEHIKRAAYQAGYVWGQTLKPTPQLPSPADWGWKHTGQCWTPRWTSLPDASSVCKELLHCGCKKSCTGRCKCVQASLDCTQLCACSGQGFCTRQET